MTAESVGPERSADDSARTPGDGIGRPLTTRQEIDTVLSVAGHMADRLSFNYRARAHHEVMCKTAGPDADTMHKLAYFLRHGTARIDTAGMGLVYQVTGAFFHTVGDGILDDAPDHPHSWATPGRVQDHAYARVTFTAARRYPADFALVLLDLVSNAVAGTNPAEKRKWSALGPMGWPAYLRRTVDPLSDRFGVHAPYQVLRMDDWMLDTGGLVFTLQQRSA